MIARLKRSWYDRSLDWTPGARETGGVWIEAEIVEPPSAAGRGVNVYLDDDDVTTLFRLLKAEAIRARATPMAKPTTKPSMNDRTRDIPTSY